jgi:hypothetical protein
MVTSRLCSLRLTEMHPLPMSDARSGRTRTPIQGFSIVKSWSIAGHSLVIAGNTMLPLSSPGNCNQHCVAPSPAPCDLDAGTHICGGLPWPVQPNNTLRPIFHVPADGEMGYVGDANGMMFRRVPWDAPTDDVGLFHLFWQCFLPCNPSPSNPALVPVCNGSATDHHELWWCHAVSRDHVTWQHLPPAVGREPRAAALRSSPTATLWRSSTTLAAAATGRRARRTAVTRSYARVDAHPPRRPPVPRPRLRLGARRLLRPPALR